MTPFWPGLDALSRLLFGPDASATVKKMAATAEAGPPKEQAMENIAQSVRGPQRIPANYTAQSVQDEAAQIYNGLIRRARLSGPFAAKMIITPALAALLLERNPGNRTLKAKVICELASDIREGRWVYNGETVILSDNGEVNDGQHRLWAVLEADAPITTMVSVGFARETRMSVDSTQTTKTTGDFLNMDGGDSGNTVGAIAAYLLQIERDGVIPLNPHNSYVKPKKSVVVEYAREHGAEIRAAVAAIPAKNTSLIASHSLMAVAYLLIKKQYQKRPADRDTYVEEFFGLLLNGGGATNSPTHAMREAMMSDKRHRRFTPRRAIEQILRAWNRHRSGRTLDKTVTTGEWPAIAH